MTTAELLDVFTPTTPAEPRDPFGGYGQERYEEREQEKREMRKRQRAVRELASCTDTPNRALWHCGQCFKPFARGEEFYMHFDTNRVYASLKCITCTDQLPTDRPPILRATLVREVL